MSITTTTATTPAPPADVATAFLAHLARVQDHARYAFRHVRCPARRDDCEAELVALAWSWFVHLARRGKRPEEFVTTLALRCSQAVRSGRRLGGSESAKDALSKVAQARHGFTVGGVDQPRDPLSRDDDLAEALADDPRGRVPDVAAFRIDFPQWRRLLGRRDRAVVDALAVGERGDDVARRFGLSPGRVSQLRAGFRESWAAFHRGEFAAG